MQTTILTAAIASLIAAVPAVAEPRTAPSPAPAAQEEAGVAPGASKQRYCYRTEMTGSRLTKKVCRTRAEWKVEGVIVPANL